MKKIIFATTNEGKVKEIRSILKDLEVQVLTMAEAGLLIDIEENGKTFEENAIIKAEALSAYTEDIVLADDSGLEIDYLNKAPGVYSARYLGKDTPYEVKNQIILNKLQDVPQEKRCARFVCAIAAACKELGTITTIGTIEGYIGYEPKGTNGFGYDPIFYVEELGTSTADLSPDVKNQISHRGKALEAMKQKLQEVLGK
ncbi:MAG: XTP/dITP diphosphatase [Cellulosilyticaceae bacterium]